MPEINEEVQAILEVIQNEKITAFLAAIATFVVGVLLARMARSATSRVLGRRVNPQYSLLAGKGVFYVVLALAATTALAKLGVNLSLLVGAAGVLTVALGFASQTSVSNLISGLFLVAEKPFEIGNLIRVDQTTGEVLAIDLLSVKLRTFDNLFVRIPNETLLKSQIINLTRFPIRRADLLLSVAYKEDLAEVEALLRRVADANPLCLDEPEPLFIITGFGDNGISLQFSAWGAREDYLDLRNSLQREIKVAFDENGVEIPFPQRVLRGALGRADTAPAVPQLPRSRPSEGAETGGTAGQREWEADAGNDGTSPDEGSEKP